MHLAGKSTCPSVRSWFDDSSAAAAKASSISNFCQTDHVGVKRCESRRDEPGDWQDDTSARADQPVENPRWIQMQSLRRGLQRGFRPSRRANPERVSLFERDDKDLSPPSVLSFVGLSLFRSFDTQTGEFSFACLFNNFTYFLLNTFASFFKT